MARTTSGTQPDRRDRRPVLLALFAAMVLGVTLSVLAVIVASVSSVSVRPPAAATAPPTATATPGLTPTTPVFVPPKCFAHPVDTHFYADTRPRNRLEGTNSFGPTLVPPGLKPGDIPTEAQIRWATLHFLERDCPDWAKANADLGTLHHGYNPAKVTDDLQIAARIQVLQDILHSADWKLTTLWYGNLPASWFTYGMIPGHPPTIYAAHYNHAASWFLVVTRFNGEKFFFRLECGGQGVFPRANLDHYFPQYTRGP